MKHIILIALTVCCLSVYAAAQKTKTLDANLDVWCPFASGNAHDTIFLFKPIDAKVYAGKVQFWVKEISLSEKFGDEVVRSMIEFQIDCPSKNLRRLKSIRYYDVSVDEKDRTVWRRLPDPWSNDKADDWAEAVPETIGEAIVSAGCKRQTSLW